VKKEVEGLKQRGLLDQNSRDLDLALFGRMVAALPRYNIEAATSVGHAITTHSFSIEADYF
jgi:CRISPR system Cascade subunit CasC